MYIDISCDILTKYSSLPWNGLSPPKNSLKTFSEFPWNVYPCVHAPASPLPCGTPFFKPSSPNWSYTALFLAVMKIVEVRDR